MDLTARVSRNLPPPVPAWCIPRAELEERLAEAAGRRLTTVVAEAGFGKSTLLARWGDGVGCAWYTVERTDDALDALSRGVVDALRYRVPEIPRDLSEARGRGGARSEERERADALVSRLCEVLRSAPADDVTLVIDDLHVLGDSSSVRFVEGLCRHAPPTLHLVLSSRAEIPFPVERLRARGEVVSIGPELLAFSEAEIGRVLWASLGESARGLARSLYEMTLGWPAAVRLAVEAMRAVDAERIPAALARLRRPGGSLFAYLAEEVFAGESPEVRAFLSRTAPLDRFTTGLCEAIGVEDAEAIVDRLLTRGLFLEPLQGEEPGWYATHGLARDFAARRWPLEDGEAREVHRRAARWFESRGLHDEAIRFMARSSDPESVARILTERGREWLARGAVEGVVRLAAELPPELRGPELEEIVGEAHTVRGESAAAEGCFRRAAGDAEVLPPGLAWRIGLMHHERGEHAEALETYGRGRVDGSRPAEEAVLLAAHASTHVLVGNVERHAELATRALEKAEATGDPHALAAAHAALMLGSSFQDPVASDRHYRRALAAAERAGDVLMVVRLRTNRASQIDHEGEYEKAIEEVEAAIDQAELAGYTERLALALNNRGRSRFHIGRIEEAISDLSRARDLYRRAGSRRTGWPLMNLGSVYRARGDLALARSACEEARVLAERSGDVQGLIKSQAELARVVVGEEPDRAARLAARAVEAGRDWGVSIVAHVAAGWVAVLRDEPERALEHAQRAAAVAHARRSRPGLARALEIEAVCGPDGARRAAALDEALAIWTELHCPRERARSELARARLFPTPSSEALAARAEAELRALGVRIEAAAGAAGLLAALPRKGRPPIEIRTLGGFRVVRHGRAVTLSEWRSKKARDLLKILIARRDRPTPRDVLMDALWPGEDPEPLSKRLSVAQATLRGVLDPDKRHPSDHFVAADDSALWLRLGHVELDVARFLAEAESGRSLAASGRTDEARAVLVAAESRYAGDFLEEDLYEEWSIELREEARATYIEVARALFRMAREAGDHDAAVRHLLRVLQRDAYDEEAYLALVSVLETAGRRGEARRFYRAYVGAMEELGVEPAPMPSAPVRNRS